MSEDTPPKAPKKRSRLFILLAPITVIICGVAGYGWWLLKQKKDADQPAGVKVEPPTAPVFIPLGTFTVNLVTADNNPDRVLYIGPTMRLPDEETRHQLRDFLPEVRSRLLMLLSRQESSQLASEVGKQLLIAQIKKVLNPPFVKGQPALVISMNDTILSQAERDALLGGNDEKDKQAAVTDKGNEIKHYDPTTQRRIVRERLQVPEIVNELFARQFRMGLFNLLRRSPDITLGAIKI